MSASEHDPKTLRRKSALGVVATLLAVALVVGLIVWWQAPDDVADAATPHRAVREALDAKAAERLTSYGWIDKEKGIVHIPVERATELILGERAAEEDTGG